MQMPPGSASFSSRAAMFTTSPWIVPPSEITSGGLSQFGDHALVFRQAGVPFGQPRLHLNCALYGIDHTGELYRQTVAGGAADPTVKLGNLGIQHLGG